MFSKIYGKVAVVKALFFLLVIRATLICEIKNRFTIQANQRWSFMTNFDPSNAKSFMMMDLRGDRSNMHYESLYKSDIAEYGFVLKKVLGGDKILEEQVL